MIKFNNTVKDILKIQAMVQQSSQWCKENNLTEKDAFFKFVKENLEQS